MRGGLLGFFLAVYLDIDVEVEQNRQTRGAELCRFLASPTNEAHNTYTTLVVEAVVPGEQVNKAGTPYRPVKDWALYLSMCVVRVNSAPLRDKEEF